MVDSWKFSQFKNVFRSRKVKKIFVVTVFVAILALACNLRKHTFHLPHLNGDQLHYVGLAFKLDVVGISEYNLRNIDMIRHPKYPEFIALSLTERDRKGGLLRFMEEGIGVTYYDQPFHHVPFGFPLAIMVSHRIFQPGQAYYLLRLPKRYEYLRRKYRGLGLKDFRFNKDIAGKQFYSIIVPFSFSLFLIILTYFLAKRLYRSNWVAFTAMFLITISPIDMLSSQKLWADSMTAALAAAAILFYILASQKKMWILALVGGIFCGFSAVTKLNGGLILIIIAIWHIAGNMDRLFRKDTFLNVLLDKRLWLFVLGFFVGSAYWFYNIMAVYGKPFHIPHPAQIAQTAKTQWYKTVGLRSRYIYFVGIPYQNPLFLLAYISPFWLLFDKKRFKNTLLLIIWVAVFLYAMQVLFGHGGKEHRYMLPAYPAFAILGAYIANRFRCFMNKRIKFHVGSIMLGIGLLVSYFWSTSIGLFSILRTHDLIPVPF